MDIILKELPRSFKKVKMDRVLGKLVRCKVSFYLRKGTECNELIYDNCRRIYSTENKNFPRRLLYLFNLVQQDCKKFLRENQIFYLPPKVNVTEYNYDYDHDSGVLTGTDLNHAFWRIAYVKGYISKNTYNKGLDDNAKALRLASLSVLGTEKSYDKYLDGVYAETVILKESNPMLQKIYLDIRYTCYYMMYELSKMLGDDFDCWRTDCINYRDTPQTRKIVHDYFDEREMLYKQLVFNSMDRFVIADTEEENTTENK